MQLRIKIPTNRRSNTSSYKADVLKRSRISKLNEQQLLAYRRIQGQLDGTFPPRPPTQYIKNEFISDPFGSF